MLTLRGLQMKMFIALFIQGRNVKKKMELTIRNLLKTHFHMILTLMIMWVIDQALDIVS